MSNRDYKDFYAEYAAKGWKPIPIKRNGGKDGIPAGATGYHGIVDEDKMLDWARDPAWMDQNIGLRMEGTLGFDLDQYDRKHGEEQYFHLIDQLEGDELPKTYSMTARGIGQPSRTYFFRVPAEAQFEQRAAEDIEILQFHHRYAMAYPSIHPKTGSEYEWYDPDGNLCDIPFVSDLAELPETNRWFTYLLKRKTRAKYSSAGGLSLEEVDLAEWTDGLSEGDVTDDLRSRLGEAAADYESGRYESTHAAIWAIGKLSTLSPELPGLRALWDEIFQARINSYSASTPEDQRATDILRSLRGSLAKWQAYRDENPLPTEAEMAWARSHNLTPAATAELVVPEPATTENDTDYPNGPPPPDGDNNNNSNNDSWQSLLDIPLAHWLEYRVRDLVCYSNALGWLFYEGGYWKSATKESITRLVMDELWMLRNKELVMTNDSKRIGDLTKLSTLAKVNTVRDSLQAIVERDATEFDNYPDHINTPRGVLNLKTLTTEPHSPKWLWTKITRGSYIPGFTHPDFESAKKSLPVDSLNYLQWKFGQALTGYPASDDKVSFLQGSGENGKSVLVTPIMNALGGFATMVPDGVLLNNRNGNAENEKVTLLGVRIAIMEELPESRHLDTKKLKELAGTEKMTGRFLYKNQITWDPTHCLFVTTNYIPQVYETDWGVWRRLALVKFPYRFRKPGLPLEYENDRVGDSTLRDRMKRGTEGQWDAVFTWMAIGAYDWYQKKCILPDPFGSVEADTGLWRRESDTILAYSEEFLEFEVGAIMAATDLVKHFNHYSRNLGSQPVNAKTMASRFLDHEMVKSNNVVSSRIYTPSDIIRPPESFSGFSNEPLSERIMAWSGVRFKRVVPTAPTTLY